MNPPALKDPLGIFETIEPTPDVRRRNVYTPRSKGRKYHLGICQFWAYLFELNGRLPAKKKMTDEEIKRQVVAEFPERKATAKLGKVGEKGQVTVNHYRQMYNMGRLSSGVAPTRPSLRYGHNGKPVDPRTGKPINRKRKPKESLP